MERVRIGLIGTSGWSGGFFLPILTSYERASLAAICGRDKTRADEAALKFGVLQVYTDYRQMINDAPLDAVVVASPDDLHYEMVMCALDKGLHVLCEKPMASNAGQAREMLEKAGQRGVKHMINFTWRWLPQVQYLKHLIREGQLGRPYQATFRFAFSPLHSPGYDRRVDADRSNGALSELGSHMIDMARFLLGDIAQVSASLTTQVEREGFNGRPLNPANDSSFVLVEFESGAHGVIHNSMVTHLANESGITFEVFCEKGTVCMDYFISTLDHSLKVAWRDEDAFHRLEIPPEFMGGYVNGNLLAAFHVDSIGPRRFIDAILDGKPVEMDFRDGYECQRVIDAALQSQRGRRSVALDHS